MTSATSSCARSSHTRETTVISSPTWTKLNRTTRDVHRLQPPDIRMESAPEVVLVYLCFVERPSVMLVLADVKPGENLVYTSRATTAAATGRPST
jgi:hypothetical protein